MSRRPPGGRWGTGTARRSTSPGADPAVPVLVVGGGPVGLSLAIRLAQLGVPATLVERHPDTATFPKGRALSIRTMEIYRSWGLEAEITAAGLPREHLAFFTGRTLVDPDGTRITTD
ncbi:NAD-binding protein, partial [Micromonospora echinofusca]|nr:NAD-binding protein [Micromonospora echinofusca]